MEIIWKKRILRILSNFGISFLTPFSGSAVAQSIYQNTVDINQMTLVGLFTSVVYTSLIGLQEIRDFASK